MSRPQFTPREELIIAHMRCYQPFNNLAFDLAHMIPVTVVLVLDFLHPTSVFPFMALFILLFFRIWEWREQLRARPDWKSIIDKYEAAVVEPKSADTA